MSEYDFTTDPDGVREEDVAADDFYLEALLSLVVGADAHEGSFDITLSLGGTMVSGTVIGVRAWERLWTESMLASAPALGSSLQLMLDDMSARAELVDIARKAEDRPARAFRYLTLKDATVWSGPVPQHLPLWRCKLSAVDGWSQGAIRSSGA
jgi:hypothetical protein